MNKLIAKLYEQAIIIEDGGDYVCGELDPVKFAQLIVRECAEQSMSIGRYNTPSGITPDLAIAIAVGLKKHFGVEEK
jgi:hypothetical protein